MSILMINLLIYTTKNNCKNNLYNKIIGFDGIQTWKLFSYGIIGIYLEYFYIKYYQKK